MAKAEKLKPIEIELKRLEGLADEIVQDFDKMHKKNSVMRAINGLFLTVFTNLILFTTIFYFINLKEIPDKS